MHPNHDDEMVRLTVKRTRSDLKFDLELPGDPDPGISDLHRLLADKSSIPEWALRVFYQGRYLRGPTSLKEQGVPQGAVLLLATSARFPEELPPATSASSSLQADASTTAVPSSSSASSGTAEPKAMPKPTPKPRPPQAPRPSGPSPVAAHFTIGDPQAGMPGQMASALMQLLSTPPLIPDSIQLQQSGTYIASPSVQIPATARKAGAPQPKAALGFLPKAGSGFTTTETGAAPQPKQGPPAARVASAPMKAPPPMPRIGQLLPTMGGLTMSPLGVPLAPMPTAPNPSSDGSQAAAWQQAMTAAQGGVGAGLAAAHIINPQVSVPLGHPMASASQQSSTTTGNVQSPRHEA
jgi:hypothetical protein